MREVSSLIWVSQIRNHLLQTPKPLGSYIFAKYEIPAKKEWTFFRFYTPGGIVDEPYHPFIGDFMAVSHPGYGRELVSMYGPIPEYGQDYRHIRLTHGGSMALDLRIYQPHLRP